MLHKIKKKQVKQYTINQQDYYATNQAFSLNYTLFSQKTFFVNIRFYITFTKSTILSKIKTAFSCVGLNN